MAIVTAYGHGEKIYEGRVLDWWEHNGAWDSDWYAHVWDDATESVKTIEIGTTRCGGGTGFRVEVDATLDVLRKVYRQKKKSATEYYDMKNIEVAKKIRKGDDVVVIKGRKVKKGTVAKCFWAGETYNYYSRRHENRIGIEVDGEKIFIAAENAEAIGWEKRLVLGRKRKQNIRAIAVEWMPCAFRSEFYGNNKEWEKRRKAEEAKCA